jgi:hypothetical protein
MDGSSRVFQYIATHTISKQQPSAGNRRFSSVTSCRLAMDLEELSAAHKPGDRHTHRSQGREARDALFSFAGFSGRKVNNPMETREESGWTSPL